MHKKYVSAYEDIDFRKWLREEKNVDDRVLLTLGTKGVIGSYRKEYNKNKKKENKKLVKRYLAISKKHWVK